jgi:glycosyltransferase involved in cell wall biosynthesis
VKSKIVIFSNSDGSVFNFRKDLIKKLTAKYDVHVISGKSPEGSYESRLLDIGVKKCMVTNFYSILIFIIKSFISPKYNNSKVIGYTHLGNFYAFFFSIFTGSQCAFNVTGLGKAYTYNNFKFIVIKFLLNNFYLISSKKLDAFFIQNPDDYDHFQRLGINSDVLFQAPGSGFNPEHIKTHVRRSSDEIKVLFFGRMIKEKGVYDFYKAAEALTLLSNKYKFFSAGTIYDNNNFFSNHSSVNYLGYIDNIHEKLSEYDVIVFPSYYREGIPRSLIESLFYGKVIITCNTVGNREVCIDGWNGFIVPTNSPNMIVSSLLKLDREKINYFGKNSIFLAMKKFHVDHVVSLIYRHFIDKPNS